MKQLLGFVTFTLLGWDLHLQPLHSLHSPCLLQLGRSKLDQMHQTGLDQEIPFHVWIFSTLKKMKWGRTGSLRSIMVCLSAGGDSMM